MKSIVTLIASPARPAITPDHLAAAKSTLGGAGDARILAEGIAAEFTVAEAEAADRLRADFASEPLDIVVQPAGSQQKRLFLADMDSTMIGQECIDELADYVGLKRDVSEITERAMRGEIAFEPALRQRVALLKGLPVSVVDEIIAERIVETPGGRTLLATMRANGAHTCLVSGGFTLFTGPISVAIGFHEHRANELLLDDGRLAGRVADPILGREAKLATLVDLRERFGLAKADVLAVGDGANDLAMLGEAGLGVAYHAKPAVAAAAHARIDHGDLSALLYIQGYRDNEFVTA